MEEENNYETILERMLGRISDKFDKREGSVIFDTHSPAAIEFQILYLELERLMNEAFADTASREFLLLHCKERGITPYDATNAVFKGKFSPSDVDVIGKRFNINSLNFIVAEEISAADGTYRLMCETAGTIGNQYSGILTPIEYVDGLETAELTELLIPGEDEEDTEDLRKRYFDSFKVTAFGGNIRDYVEKTNAIPGVGSTKVTRAHNGGGTVLLTIIDSDFNAATDTLLNTVKQLIDPAEKTGEGVGLAPIDHRVTVESADTKQIRISAELTLESNYRTEDVIAFVKSVVESYLAELRKLWGDTENLIVRVSQIETRLLSVSGVIDAENITINGERKNVILNTNQIPILGEVTIS